MFLAGMLLKGDADIMGACRASGGFWGGGMGAAGWLSISRAGVGCAMGGGGVSAGAGGAEGMKAVVSCGAACFHLDPLMG